MTEPNTDSTAALPLCPHFGECGGCVSQDVSYPDQLAAKARMLEERLRDFWPHPIPVEGSPRVWHYRNKVDFNFAPRQYEEAPPPGFERETLLGFTRPGKWYWPIDVHECRIAPVGAEALLAGVKAWYRAHDLRAYHSKSKTGFLRALMLREGQRTGEKMVALFTSPGDLDAAAFVDAVREAIDVQSIYWGISSGGARGVFADELRLLHGSDTIREEMHIGGRVLRFRISPMSFFQTNTLAAERLYSAIREWVRTVAPRILYDLYGGMGGIAFACADLVDTVRSVESVEAATLDGEANARDNGIGNVYFTNAVMKEYLRQIGEEGGMESSSAVIVDPPRAGMTPKPLRRLVKAGAPHLLYVSCKPSVFAEELPALLSRYEIEWMRAFDLFPHTPHVELLAAFRRRGRGNP
jgi:23S rRNA (uracil1939-C5)-methyltransferase